MKNLTVKLTLVLAFNITVLFAQSNTGGNQQSQYPNQTVQPSQNGNIQNNTGVITPSTPVPQHTDSVRVGGYNAGMPARTNRVMQNSQDSANTRLKNPNNRNVTVPINPQNPYRDSVNQNNTIK